MVNEDGNTVVKPCEGDLSIGKFYSLTTFKLRRCDLITDKANLLLTGCPYRAEI